MGNLESPQTGILSRKALPSGGKTTVYPVPSSAVGFLPCGVERNPEGLSWRQAAFRI